MTKSKCDKTRLNLNSQGGVWSFGTGNRTEFYVLLGFHRFFFFHGTLFWNLIWSFISLLLFSILFQCAGSTAIHCVVLSLRFGGFRKNTSVFLEYSKQSQLLLNYPVPEGAGI